MQAGAKVACTGWRKEMTSGREAEHARGRVAMQEQQKAQAGTGVGVAGSNRESLGKQKSHWACRSNPRIELYRKREGKQLKHFASESYSGTDVTEVTQSEGSQRESEYISSEETMKEEENEELQALIYPLLVACKSISNLCKAAAQEVVNKVRQHSGVLVDQAQLVSKELIRVAILWHELWHEALEEARRLYFDKHNVEGMLKAYHHDLSQAYECCMEYKRTGKDAELTQSVSPELVDYRDLELAVPGTYRAQSPVVTIASFAHQLDVITSKQRPRKFTFHGSDGEDYAFLLKGHEDLRQDERVMQLFGLVNTLLQNSRKTAEKDLSIQRYAVIPLSPNSGLIGWVPNCDTLYHLIREYRDARRITLNQEHKYMLSFAPDYDHLPLIAKVEVLWLKSRTSEVWLERRTNYTRSLAVMSMVPFRLTRMLVKAMEVSGIGANFRSMCENVMQVLRSNKDSVMDMMEAANQFGDANEVLNERAVVAMARMSNKLTGHDFSSCSSIPTYFIQHAVDHSTLISGDNREVEHGLSVELQVQKLIIQATSTENL
ncbi:hypothetical protein CRYUN_Cryun06bG0061800 [Craigia yunnanensis]